MFRLFVLLTCLALASTSGATADDEFLSKQESARACLSNNPSRPEKCLAELFSPCAAHTDEKKQRFCVNDLVRDWSLASTKAKDQLIAVHGDAINMIVEPRSSYDRQVCGNFAPAVVSDPAKGSGIHNTLCLAMARAASWSLYSHRASEIAAAATQLATDLEAVRACVWESATVGKQRECIGMLSIPCSSAVSLPCISEREERIWMNIFIDGNSRLPKGAYKQMVMSGELEQFNVRCPADQESCKARKKFASAAIAIHFFLAAHRDR